ncbi:rhodanese-like domain-containing protein [Edaphobacter modestus]|uniref:Rhodanese-related sulfurtransferase n=1 Tax=Edaphobacter modestus TaxID=388466 RepID=A0A4Q7YZV4_9BACT|nr:rhodanese-like domain-containing protein [Edaphobacter modestus]RZU43400.1 rhodanese-related sulfurtransferase [Edaphobacter modestus]
MLFATAVSVVVAVLIAIVGALIWMRRSRRLRELERYTVEAETLRELLDSDSKILVLDVRQPLDLLAHSEIIPGAKRLSPKEVEADPSLIPSDRDVVLYCTCEGQKTSREILRRGLSLGFQRVKLLRGGFSAWKAKGYPVIPYKDSFRLDTVV